MHRIRYKFFAERLWLKLCIVRPHTFMLGSVTYENSGEEDQNIVHRSLLRTIMAGRKFGTERRDLGSGEDKSGAWVDSVFL